MVSEYKHFDIMKTEVVFSKLQFSKFVLFFLSIKVNYN